MTKGEMTFVIMAVVFVGGIVLGLLYDKSRYNEANKICEPRGMTVESVKKRLFCVDENGQMFSLKVMRENHK